jgi:phosphopantothenoylcysteine decarboxylase / phosphopantothenate---cysteine ligase
MTDLTGKSIVLGVTGGIAAYKAASIASLFIQAGASLEVVMTEAAHKFVRPLTFSAITHASVHTDPFSPWHGSFTGHVGLAKNADLLVIAPATAATIAKLALGLADDLIALIALSTTAPTIVAPAMEEQMLHHPATRANLRTLTGHGITIVEPAHGRLASGAIGEGRMASPESVVAVAMSVLGRSTRLAGKKFVITAGGTREPLDPVRYIGNRSSGIMGYALATAALAKGADVTLISTTLDLRPPNGVALVNVETAAEMHHAVEQASADADVLIMAAAVADFRPEIRSQRKLKKSPNQDYLDVRLVRNPDILATISRPNLLKVGFAAETENLLENAAQKLHSKGLAMIVANDAESTIGAASSTATILTAGGEVTALPTLSKESLAVEIVSVIGDLLVGTNSRAP